MLPRRMIDSDLVPPILEALRDNYDALYKCSLVCKEFNVTASRLLYCHVVFSPPFRPVLNLRDRGGLTVSILHVPLYPRWQLNLWLAAIYQKGTVSIYVRMPSALCAVGGRTENQR